MQNKHGNKENKDLLSQIYQCFYWWNFLRFAGPLNIFVPSLVLVDKKIKKTKFEVEEENTKLQIARKLPL